MAIRIKLFWKSDWEGAKEENGGGGDQISIGPRTELDFYRVKRGLIKFDLTDTILTPRDWVKDASLMLRLRGIENTGNQTLHLYRLIKPWDEMTSCWNRAHEGAANWNGCDPDSQWVNPDPVCSITASTQTGWYEWYGQEMADLVQDWITNPATNYGVLIKLEDDFRQEDHRFRFHSSDVADSTLRPSLEIVYEKKKVVPVFKAEIVAYPTSGNLPLTVKFDASNSFSPNGVETFSWDFDLSDGVDEDTTGMIITHTFYESGARQVKLTTIDSVNVRGDEIVTIHVEPEIITANLQPGSADGIDNYMEVKTTWAGSKDENSGAWTEVGVGTEDGSGYYRRYRGLLKFDLSPSGIAIGDSLLDAKLKLYCRKADNNGVTNRFNIHQILVPWDEMSSCWNRPQTGGSDWDGCNPNSTWASSTVVDYIEKQNQTGWYVWEGEGIRNLVHDWLDDPGENHGFLIKLPNDDVDEDHKYKFWSSDYTIDTTLCPILEITYMDLTVVGKKRADDQDESEIEIPETYELKQNYPNPFNPTTTIQYHLPSDTHVLIRIYDMMGREIASLVDKDIEAGIHEVIWEGRNSSGGRVTSGIYFMRIQAGEFQATKKMLLIK